MEKVLEKETSREDMSEQEEIVEEHTEVILGTTAGLTWLEVSRGIDSFKEILEEMTEVAAGHDQDQGQVKLETEFDASDVENIIILPKIALTWR